MVACPQVLKCLENDDTGPMHYEISQHRCASSLQRNSGLMGGQLSGWGSLQPENVLKLAKTLWHQLLMVV